MLKKFWKITPNDWKWLVEGGVKPKEAYSASLVALFIQFFDSPIFGKAKFLYDHPQRVNKWAATYLYLTDRYFIDTNDLHKYLICGDVRDRILLRKKRGRYYERITKRSFPMWLTALGLAAHEVRHRIQTKRKDTRLFSPADVVKKPRTEVDCIVKYVDWSFRFLHKHWIEQGKDDAFIRKQMHVREFDSRVIQILVMTRARRQKNRRGLAKLVLLEPR